jgi:hypothetical protein
MSRLATKISKTVSIAAALGLLLLATGPAAQEAEEEIAEGETAPEAARETHGDERTAEALERQSEEIEQLRRELGETRSRVEELEIAREEDLLARAAREAEQEQKLGIYGFFDLSAGKFFLDNSPFFDGIINDDFSFFVQHLNVYFSGHISETVSALAEVGFTFLPNGMEESYAVPQYGVEYERNDTTVSDPFTSEKRGLGGVYIERVHVSWQPRDWFGVTAGRFLTPFGIWNVDHGTPVLLTVRHPFIMVNKVVPTHQIGLQFFGRFYPAANTYLDYALTLSNGRGPTESGESSYDLDDNKSGGLRLRLAYEGTDVKLAAGAYGYIGDVTDHEKTIESFEPFRVVERTTSRYTEYVITADLLVELWALRIQGEMARGIVRYSRRPLLTPPDGNGYPADYYKSGYYGLISYEFDLSAAHEGMTLAPYFMAEHNDDNDTSHVRGSIYTVGLNLKPIPQVAIKAETFCSVFPEFPQNEEGEMGPEQFWGIFGQVAVAF